MAILGTPVSSSVILDVIQRASTRVHQLVHDILNLNAEMAQILDADIEAMFVASGYSSENASTATSDFRSWQAALKGYADNYTGDGSLTDKSYEIAKRVRPTI